MLAYFDNNETRFEAVAAQGQAAILRALNAATLPDGSAATPAQAFSDVRRDASGRVVAARLAKWVRAGRLWCCHQMAWKLMLPALLLCRAGALAADCA